MEFTIRPVRRGDEEGWVAVAWDRWQDTYGHHFGPGYFTPERRQSWVDGWVAALTRLASEGPDDDAPPDAVSTIARRQFVAVDKDGRIVGIALAGAAGRHSGSEPVRDAELNILYVTVQAQGSGVAQALMEAVLPDAVPAQLWVSADNGRAQAFYRKYGFEPDGTATLFADLIPEIRMVR